MMALPLFRTRTGYPCPIAIARRQGTFTFMLWGHSSNISCARQDVYEKIIVSGLLIEFRDTKPHVSWLLETIRRTFLVNTCSTMNMTLPVVSPYTEPI